MRKSRILIAGTALLLALTGCNRESPQPQGSAGPHNTLSAPPVAPAPVHDQAQATSASAAAPALQPRSAAEPKVAASDQPRYVTRKRSKKKSAAIIGGSAAAGAAIGALAGGGKGAGIGAIAGGVGGLIYDRKTAKKSERIDQ